MQKALDDLERAVDRLVQKASGKTIDRSDLRAAETSTGKDLSAPTARPPDQANEEAAELIRRAIRRLRSL